MKKAALVMIMMMSLSLFAQNDEAYVNEQVNEFTSKLESRGINSWYTNKRFCDGSIEMFQMDDGRMCSSKGTYYAVYVVWEEDGTSMIKKIDNCGLFYSIPLKSNELTSFVQENYTELQLNSVKPYKADNISGQPTLRTATHPCKRSFVFKNENGVMKQKYDLYDLTTSETNPNTNYDYNKALPIVTLDSKLDKVIGALESKFKRQKQ